MDQRLRVCSTALALGLFALLGREGGIALADPWTLPEENACAAKPGWIGGGARPNPITSKLS